jgi:hypothetical protein
MHWCADETAMLVTALSSGGFVLAWLRGKWSRLKHFVLCRRHGHKERP